MCKSKDQMNLDLCIYEAVSYTVGTMEAAFDVKGGTEDGYSLPNFLY